MATLAMPARSQQSPRPPCRMSAGSIFSANNSGTSLPSRYPIDRQTSPIRSQRTSFISTLAKMLLRVHRTTCIPRAVACIPLRQADPDLAPLPEIPALLSPTDDGCVSIKVLVDIGPPAKDAQAAEELGARPSQVDAEETPNIDLEGVVEEDQGRDEEPAWKPNAKRFLCVHLPQGSPRTAPLSPTGPHRPSPQARPLRHLDIAALPWIRPHSMRSMSRPAHRGTSQLSSLSKHGKFDDDI